MDPELKELYIYILKKRWTPANQAINPHWWNSVRSDYCYFVELEPPSKMVDKDIYLIKVGDQWK
jgi:hypothetical protein